MASSDAQVRPDGRFVATEHRFTGREDMASTDWGTATKTIICKSCGAETIYDANAIANTCPYCGSVQVMPAGNDQQKIMAPGGVVTVDVDEDEFRYCILNDDLLVVNEEFYYDIEKDQIYDTPCGERSDPEDDGLPF